MAVLLVSTLAATVAAVVLLVLMMRRDRSALGVYALGLLIVAGVTGSVYAMVDAT